MKTVALALCLLALRLGAANKTETDLRSQLAASEAARVKDKTDLRSALEKLTAQEAKRSAVANARDEAAAKSKTDIHTQLAASEAALSHANKDKGELSASLENVRGQNAVVIAHAADSSDKAAKGVERLKNPAYITLVASLCSMLVGLFALLKVVVLKREGATIRVLVNGRMDKLLETSATEAEARGALRGAAEERARTAESAQPDPDILRASQLYLKNHAAPAMPVKAKRRKGTRLDA